MKVEVQFAGPLACFTRPDLKVERVSYPVMTPSAARGAVESILWRPAVFWVVSEIRVLRPIRFLSIKRNEVNDRASEEIDLFLADHRRAQRNTLALRDAAYVVTVEPRLTRGAAQGDTVKKFVEMLQRRIRRGQCFQQPYLGCREMAASYSEPSGESPIDETLDLGRMLHDVQYGEGCVAHYFPARLDRGVLRIPEPHWIGRPGV